MKGELNSTCIAAFLLGLILLAPPGCDAYRNGVTAKQMEQISATIATCEKSLPRDKVCEVVITARVKEQKP